MKNINLIFTSVFIFSWHIVLSQTTPAKTTLKRADSFFGVHFDLHANEGITDAGKTLTEEMVDSFLKKVRPDFIQVDCKGHPGISSYPTKVGYHVKGFEKDPLLLFRKVTAQNKVALYVHFSGVWDGKVVKEHPGWAIVKSNGERSTEKTSFFSPYLDSFMIPQLKEISDYKVDGAWVDGECWAVEPDYGAASVNRFTKETGITAIPKNDTGKYYPAFIEYTRLLFREHLNKYINSIHQYNPQFQITSNWAYSSLMPEKVTANVDFLSGDVTPQNGVYRSAFEARCLAGQGKPWDLMSWGFSWNGDKTPLNIKSAIQLEQEAAEVISMGGGVQFYFQQNADLSIKPWLAKPLSEIAAFCRLRQPYVHKAKALPQIALVFPTVAYQRSGKNPYSNATGKLQGALYAILDGQHTTEVLSEQQLSGNMQQYPLIVVPECDYLEPAFKAELISYAKNGGTLLIAGASAAKLFEQELGIAIQSTTGKDETFITASGKLGAIRSAVDLITLQTGTKATANFYDNSDFINQSNRVASTLNNIGSGKIAAIYFDAGSAYLEYKSPVLRDFFNDRIRELFREPLVTVTGSHLVHVAVNKLHDHIMINLVNTAGEHTNEAAVGYDEIPSLKNLTITFRLAKKPVKILLQPGEVPLPFTYGKGVAKLVVSELLIHSVLEVFP